MSSGSSTNPVQSLYQQFERRGFRIPSNLGIRRAPFILQEARPLNLEVLNGLPWKP